MIIVYAGVQADAPGHATTRLPIENHKSLQNRVRGLFQALKPRLVVGALASGSDILIAEAALAEGCELNASLPFDVQTFRSNSVTPSGNAWEQRFDRITGSSNVYVSVGTADPKQTDIYRQHNSELLNHAASLAKPGERIWTIVIRPTPDEGQPSVTDDFAAKATAHQRLLIDLNPTVSKNRAFVAMGYGEKFDPTQRITYDLDSIFHRVYQPVLETLNLNWTRADLEIDSGIIHIGMIENLANSDLVIADLSTLNFNVAYELGVRHALAPHSTVLVNPQISGTHSSPPFDVNFIRSVTFERDVELTDEQAEFAIRRLLPVASEAVLNSSQDSPVYTWFDLDDVPRPHIQRSEIAPALARELEVRQIVNSALLSSDTEPMLSAAAAVADANDLKVETRKGLRLQLASALIDETAYSEAAELLELEPEDAEAPLHRVWLQKLIMAYRRMAENEGDPVRADELFDRAEHHIHIAINSHSCDSETFGIYGGFLKRKLTREHTEIGPVAAKALFQSMRTQYQIGFEREPSFYTGVNLTMATRLEMRLTDTHVDDLKHVFKESLIVSKFLARHAMKESPRDFWAAASHAELLLHEALESGAALNDATSAYASARLIARPDHVRSAVHQLDFMAKWGDPLDSVEAAKSALLGTS
ncbi:hypothetical protein I6E81_00210 [Salinibacterium sp. NG22]|uniref:tetratricopeptide repeat-containing protein n=1 Tax=Salinibacterium sp. NG22 TaxID=2792040 RepID=UPI0018CC7E42|nr:tetratricopeptide repeat-containing protein [Salinibacterium sp. NG22]MBH0108586.1 hypothetical protein [Salinibacterium sp. NG22]